MSLKEILTLLGDPAKLGAISFFLMALIKKLRPSIKDDVAWALSVVVAVVVAYVAKFLVPYADKLPHDVLVMWPVLIWAGSQLWYKLLWWLGLAADAVRAKLAS